MLPVSPEMVETFGLLLVRSLSFFMAGPIFSQRSVPPTVRLLLGLGTALALFPIAPVPEAPIPGLFGFFLAVAGEVFLGLLLGFAAGFPFVGIRMAAGLVGVQMGFGVVNVFDPQQGHQVALLSRFYDLLALLLFLLMNGHHLLLRALGLSLRAVPLGGAEVAPGLGEALLGLAGSMFVTMLAVGAPLIAVLFLTDAAMGFVARMVPQMNIFIVGFPVKIGLGLFAMAVTLPYFVSTVDRLTSSLEQDLLALLAGM